MQSRSIHTRLILVSLLVAVVAGLPQGRAQAREQAAAGPVIAVPVHPSSFPRILVWLPKESRVVEQALSEAIVRQALDREDIYYKIVDNEDALEASSRTGLFNACLLFEPEEMMLRKEFLKDVTRRGQGVVLIGTGASARSAAERLGFVLDEPSPKKKPAGLIVAPNRGMNLSGDVPISGRVLYPRKKGSLVVASYAGSGKSAALLDQSGKSRVLVMPFPLTKSSYQAGTAAPYSLLLRAVVLAVVPEKDEAEGPTAEGLSVTSPSGPASVRLKVTLPPGSQLLWAGTGGRIERNTVIFDIQADQQPRSVYYLYQAHVAGSAASSAELFVQQNGAYLSQGIVR
jgi:hypothetical protein